MLHKQLEKSIFLISIGLVLFSSLADSYFEHLKFSGELEFDTLIAFLTGSLIRNSAKFFLLAYCMKALLDRMVFFIQYRKTLSIFTVGWFLTLIFVHLFYILLIDELFIEIDYGIKPTLYWIEKTFMFVGFIYVLQALKKETGITYRRAFFVLAFVGMMFFFAVMQFYGIEI